MAVTVRDILRPPSVSGPVSVPGMIRPGTTHGQQGNSRAFFSFIAHHRRASRAPALPIVSDLVLSFSALPLLPPTALSHMFSSRQIPSPISVLLLFTLLPLAPHGCA